MPDMTAIWRDDADEEDVIAAYQELIDTGDAWMLEGHVGRNAMHLIEMGYCSLGPVGHRTYWGGWTPSRTDVTPGTKGSIEYTTIRRTPLP